MVSFKDLKDDSARNLDLATEVERLRLEVDMAHKGYLIAEEEPSPGSILQGFNTPDDFVVKEKTLDYGNGEVYKGECLGNLRHGNGKHTCADGTTYQGGWKYDKRDGKGKIQFKDGLMYDGEWKDDKAHGSGVAQYQNGSVFIGDFQHDQRCGWGTQYFSSNERYEGEWRDDKMTGKGRWTYQDGSYYEGEWEGGERVRGKLVAADGGYEYSGGWKDGRKEGYGVEFQRGVCKYMGGWRQDKREGEGKCIYADDSFYDGSWKDGMRHGRGKLVSVPYKYEGEWVEDKEEGQGAAQWDNGDKYVGEFRAGQRHGAGRCVFGDGSKYEGGWEAGKRHGKGSCLYANGDRYQGEWQRDRRHGYGVCKFEDGTKFRGEWEDDGWVQSAADPSKCRVAGPGVTRAVAGQQAELVIQARDEAGNKRLSGGDEFQVAIRGPASVAASVQDKEDGTYAVAYTPTVAGVYQLHITIGAGEHVADSPYPLRVLPGRPCPRRCRVEGEGRGRAVEGREAEFEVLVHDEFGNRWFGESLAQLLPLDITLECGGKECDVTMAPQRDGRYTCRYTPSAPGMYRLHVLHGTAPLPGTPFSVQVIDSKAHERMEAHAGGEDAAGAESTSAAAAPPLSAAVIRDEMKAWEEKAAAAYAADGAWDGWDSDKEDKERKKTAEERFIESNPGVAVVENLEDMWVLSKLQRERKAKEEAEKQSKLKEMKAKLEASFGAPQLPDPSQVAQEVQQIVQEDLLAHNIVQLNKQPSPPPSTAAVDAAGKVRGEAAASAHPSSPSSCTGQGGVAAKCGADLPTGASVKGSASSDGDVGKSHAANGKAVAAGMAPRPLPSMQRLRAAAAVLEELD